MTITGKIKTIDNSIDEIQFDEITITFKIIEARQKKAQYDLDRQTA